MQQDYTIKCQELAKELRKAIIETAHDVGKLSIHFGASMSIAEILAVLYGYAMKYDAKNPEMEDRDRLILSKGHAYPALYCILSLCGYFSKEELKANYMTDGGLFPAHPIKNLSKGIECSSGSLGNGLSFAVGKALNAKKKNLEYTTYAIVGDGECEEGSIMEAFMAAAQLKLDNLVVFIDCNKMQQDGTTEEVLSIDFQPLLSALGWDVISLDGNDVGQIIQALDNRGKDGKPLAIIANTIKGKGISFMENDNKWHHAALNKKQYEQAIQELS